MRFDIKAVVDREGETGNDAVLVQWVAPERYRVAVWNELDAQWEYTETVRWAGVISALRLYGCLD